MTAGERSGRGGINRARRARPRAYKAPVQLPQGGALAIASAICSGVRSR